MQRTTASSSSSSELAGATAFKCMCKQQAPDIPTAAAAAYSSYTTYKRARNFLQISAAEGVLLSTTLSACTAWLKELCLSCSLLTCSQQRRILQLLGKFEALHVESGGHTLSACTASCTEHLCVALVDLQAQQRRILQLEGEVEALRVESGRQAEALQQQRAQTRAAEARMQELQQELDNNAGMSKHQTFVKLLLVEVHAVAVLHASARIRTTSGSACSAAAVAVFFSSVAVAAGFGFSTTTCSCS